MYVLISLVSSTLHCGTAHVHGLRNPWLDIQDKVRSALNALKNKYLMPNLAILEPCTCVMPLYKVLVTSDSGLADVSVRSPWELLIFCTAVRTLKASAWIDSTSMIVFSPLARHTPLRNGHVLLALCVWLCFGVFNAPYIWHWSQGNRSVLLPPMLYIYWTLLVYQSLMFITTCTVFPTPISGNRGYMRQVDLCFELTICNTVTVLLAGKHSLD